MYFYIKPYVIYKRNTIYLWIYSSQRRKASVNLAKSSGLQPFIKSSNTASSGQPFSNQKSPERGICCSRRRGRGIRSRRLPSRPPEAARRYGATIRGSVGKGFRGTSVRRRIAARRDIPRKESLYPSASFQRTGAYRSNIPLSPVRGGVSSRKPPYRILPNFDLLFLSESIESSGSKRREGFFAC